MDHCVVSDRDVNSRGAIFGAIAVMVMVPMFFLVLPLYVGALADDFGFSISQIGNLTFIELAGAALASLSGLFWLRRVQWRTILFILLALLAVLNAASILVGGSYESLLPLRGLAGLIAGGLMVVALAALGDTDNPDRNFGYGVVGQLSVSGILLVALPWFVADRGVTAIFAVFLLAALAALPATYWVPARGKASAVGNVSSGSRQPIWGLAGTAAVFVAQAAVWAFIERIGVSAGLAPETIGLALGVSVAAGIAGALFASWLSARVGRFRPMLFAMIGEVVCLCFFFGEIDAVRYFSVVIAYGIFWNFWLPFQMGVVAEVDVTGRFIALITFSQAAGIAIGPALVAPFLTTDNYDAVILAGIGFAVLAMLLFLPITRRAPARDSAVSAP